MFLSSFVLITLTLDTPDIYLYSLMSNSYCMWGIYVNVSVGSCPHVLRYTMALRLNWSTVESSGAVEEEEGLYLCPPSSTGRMDSTLEDT